MKLIDRLLAIFALGLFALFCLVLVVVVGRIDLGIVVVTVIAMVAYDFYNETVREPAAALKAKAEVIRQRAEMLRAQNDPHAQRDQI